MKGPPSLGRTLRAYRWDRPIPDSNPLRVESVRRSAGSRPGFVFPVAFSVALSGRCWCVSWASSGLLLPYNVIMVYTIAKENTTGKGGCPHVLTYEYKCDGTRPQYAAIDEAIRVVQFIRNKCLRKWMDERDVCKNDLQCYCAVLADTFQKLDGVTLQWHSTEHPGSNTASSTRFTRTASKIATVTASETCAASFRS